MTTVQFYKKRIIKTISPFEFNFTNAKVFTSKDLKYIKLLSNTLSNQLSNNLRKI